MGKVYAAGFGPGGPEGMTAACLECLRESDAIIGYTGYLELMRPLLPGKDFIETPMTKEVERCKAAISLAKDGKTVCVVSSGDSGVYGMASLLLELADGEENVSVEIIPGVTAAVSGASVLGAPVANDFAVISLSDLLTPWKTIEKRLRAAASGDFAICLYNPGSKKRAAHLRAACDILLEELPESRICGIARNIGRGGQNAELFTLGELRSVKADMNETIFIGNSNTREIGGKMVTPRGYRNV